MSDLFLETVREGAVIMTGRAFYNMGVAFEMTCHLHILIMSGEPPTGVQSICKSMCYVFTCEMVNRQ